ncbi:MAG: DUF4288 domain-containing protein [Bacteroidetes bacterium]|nr:DUF4288 domain-containing protein [Bacteroidota bacterium]
MNWYLSKIVFRIICGEGDHTAQFDEQLRLISASDECEAFAKATAIGQSEQDDFYNHEQQLVQWKFINVAELYRLSGLLDGAEMYSRIQESDDAEAYIDATHRRAEHIRSTGTHKILRLL